MWRGVLRRLLPAPLIHSHQTCCFLFTLIFPDSPIAGCRLWIWPKPVVNTKGPAGAIHGNLARRLLEPARQLPPRAQPRRELRRRGPKPPGSRFGVVGYCYTGGFALRVAAACPERIAAAASFHGGSLVTDAPTSPHLLLPRIQAQLYFGHAVDDRSMPEDAIRTLDAALETWGGEYESEIYEGAHHGWTASDNPAYNAAQADRAFSKLTDLFAAALP